MEKITLNGKRYISLGDFDHLRHNLCKDIYEGYERGEDGKIHLSETDMAKIDAYHRMMQEVMSEEIAAAESPDDIRKMHESIRKEWMHDKFIIVANDNGENVYYRKMCRVGENGELEPVFTSKVRLAQTWSDHFSATLVLQTIQNDYDIEAMVDPLYLHVITTAEARKLLKAIFKDDEPEYKGDGTRAEDEDWDGNEGGLE